MMLALKMKEEYERKSEWLIEAGKDKKTQFYIEHPERNIALPTF